MNRRAFIMPVLLLLVAAIGILATTILTAAARRGAEARAHQARVQGREWCLGARLLPAGSAFERGAWRIAVAADGRASAAGPLGTYHLAADGHEAWERRP